MPGYHFKNSRASTKLDEPVWLTKFFTTWILPDALRSKYGNVAVIDEQLKKINGLNADKLPETISQAYRFHKRRYAGSVVETNIDLDMLFEVNVDENGLVYPYNIFKDWCKLIYDPNTGNMSIKKDYVGQITIQIHTKAGKVLREVYIPIIFPIDPPNAWDLEFANEAHYELSMKFAAENQTDLIIGVSPTGGG